MAVALPIAATIAAEIEPFFIYATGENPSKVWATFTDAEGFQRCKCIYQRCVHCNIERFTPHQLDKPPIGVDVFWCPTCSDEVIQAVKKYTRDGLGCTAEERDVFGRLWRDHICSRSHSMS